MSIWEVRNNKQNFVYSKIMMWVALDRGLRLADRRCLPCPNRPRWLEARDNLYEEIMEKGACPLSACFSPPRLSAYSAIATQPAPQCNRPLKTEHRLQRGDGLLHPELREQPPAGLVNTDRAPRVLHRAQ